jgi:hypothetical protein
MFVCAFLSVLALLSQRVADLAAVRGDLPVERDEIGHDAVDRALALFDADNSLGKLDLLSSRLSFRRFDARVQLGRDVRALLVRFITAGERASLMLRDRLGSDTAQQIGGDGQVAHGRTQVGAAIVAVAIARRVHRHRLARGLAAAGENALGQLRLGQQLRSSSAFHSASRQTGCSQQAKSE